ncbi:MAG: MBL fold metallo-hydrolase [Candidatus Krumholzibacteria bacterium]|nr:MBL fold metallo-hydrolase [Candidatus Krumholzibacteria bacterium]
MHLRVTVLGSGTIIPSAERKPTALLIEAGQVAYLFDCGPGILQALEDTGFSFRSLNRVLFTHFHPDHTLGIGRLLAAINNDPASDKRQRLVFYGPCGLSDFIGRWNELYCSTTPGGDCLELVEVGAGEVLRDGDVWIRAVRVEHGDHEALAYRVDRRDASIVYTGDTAFTESLVELAKDTDLLVSECSFPDDRPAEGHLTPSDVGRLASRSRAGRVVLVHLYPVFEGSDPARSVKKHYGGPVIAARDGMTIDL